MLFVNASNHERMMLEGGIIPRDVTARKTAASQSLSEGKFRRLRPSRFDSTSPRLTQHEVPCQSYCSKAIEQYSHVKLGGLDRQ